MARWTDVVAAIESGAVDDPVVPFEGPTVLAVDVLGDLAAAFSFTWRPGQAMEVAHEITFAFYTEGRWLELRTNGGGSSGDPPWHRQRTGFSLFLGCQDRCGFGYLDLPALIASAGIYGPGVVAVRASGSRADGTPITRVVPIRSHLGAFIVLLDTRSDVDIIPLGSSGQPVGEQWPARRGDTPASFKGDETSGEAGVGDVEPAGRFVVASGLLGMTLRSEEEE